MRTGNILITMALLFMLGACATPKPIPTVDHVDLQRYMGDWYVIAHIPAFIEADAHNAVESYHLDEEGRIQTTYTFLDGGFDEEMEIMQPVGTVKNTDTNAEWGMQFADSGGIPDHLSGRGLPNHNHQSQPSGLRLDHGALTGNSGRGIRKTGQYRRTAGL